MIIAERVLKLQTSSGERDVVIALDAPRESNHSWQCDYTIRWPDRTWSSFGAGTDAFQALILAVQKIATELYFSEEHKAGSLSWTADWSGYGFPMPGAGRDLMVGNDRKFF